ncbi:hypothetical protein [Mycobacterium sp. M23085]|uniref:hypothetical protein n=1 Tax=Mycobacterium sp. M23085 TaxID=3378087 RepID=UPI003877D56C
MTDKSVTDGTNTSVVQDNSVESAARSGDSSATLVALRDRLAREIDECRSKRDLAALSARLSAVLTQIQDMPHPVPSKRDEIAQKRARRQAEAAARSLVEGQS